MTPEQFDRLVAAGMTTDQIGVVMKMLAEETAMLKAAEEARKAVARERVQKWRAKRNVTEMQPKRNGNAPQRLTRADPSLSTLEITGKEESKDTSPPARSRGERIPTDFIPDIEWAGTQGLPTNEAAIEANQFLDYWRSKPGKDGLKLDWPGTWRMWVRNAIKRRSSQGPPGKRRNYFDVAQDRVNGNGTEGLFGDGSDAQRFSPRLIESRPHDENLRGGIAGRVVRINR